MWVVVVAQWLLRWAAVPKVVGSIPVTVFHRKNYTTPPLGRQWQTTRSNLPSKASHKPFGPFYLCNTETRTTQVVARGRLRSISSMALEEYMWTCERLNNYDHTKIVVVQY